MEQRNTEKLSDKAFVRLILTSILGVLVCIVCLCSTTYAWFSDCLPSNNNEIKTASECLLTVSVVDTTDGTELENIESESDVALEKGVQYTVTLTLPKDSASGYCVIETATEKKYYTDYIVRHEGPQSKTLSFTLTVEESQTVTFTTCWGIYSGDLCDVKDGKLNIPNN